MIDFLNEFISQVYTIGIAFKILKYFMHVWKISKIYLYRIIYVECNFMIVLYYNVTIYTAIHDVLSVGF